jgi:hypothetical protein
MRPGANFLKALEDYLFLLDRRYPQKTILKMVGDHYALSGDERALLFRGSAKKQQLKLRSKKKISLLPKKSVLYVDGFNVFRTIGSYLTGNFVFEGMDGFVRDASELHRQKLSWDILGRVSELVVDYLKFTDCRQAYFYFDSPISHSGDLVNQLLHKMKEASLKGTAETDYSPDHILKEIETGLICTSDSNIIDQSKVNVYDLSKGVLEHNFDPNIFSLKSYLNL